MNSLDQMFTFVQQWQQILQFPVAIFNEQMRPMTSSEDLLPAMWPQSVEDLRWTLRHIEFQGQDMYLGLMAQETKASSFAELMLMTLRLAEEKKADEAVSDHEVLQDYENFFRKAIFGRANQLELEREAKILNIPSQGRWMVYLIETVADADDISTADSGISTVDSHVSTVDAGISTADSLVSTAFSSISTADAASPELIFSGEEDVLDSRLDILRNLHPDKPLEMVLADGKHRFILIKDFSGTTNLRREVYRVACSIEDTLGAEALEKVIIAYGEEAESCKDFARAYQEAETALRVGSIFQEDSHIIDYSRLGISRLLYQLPLKSCEGFLKETLDGHELSELDDDTRKTANCFLENNLNISETARQLIIHRNTLIYRLDKIQKLFGLDLRVYDDAVEFFMAQQVDRYVHYLKRGHARV